MRAKKKIQVNYSQEIYCDLLFESPAQSSAHRFPQEETEQDTSCRNEVIYVSVGVGKSREIALEFYLLA